MREAPRYEVTQTPGRRWARSVHQRWVGVAVRRVRPCSRVGDNASQTSGGIARVCSLSAAGLLAAEADAGHPASGRVRGPWAPGSLPLTLMSAPRPRPMAFRPPPAGQASSTETFQAHTALSPCSHEGPRSSVPLGIACLAHMPRAPLQAAGRL